MEKRHYSKRQWLWLFYNWRIPVLRYKKTDNVWVLNIPYNFQTMCRFRRRKEFVLSRITNKTELSLWTEGLGDQGFLMELPEFQTQRSVGETLSESRSTLGKRPGHQNSLWWFNEHLLNPCQFPGGSPSIRTPSSLLRSPLSSYPEDSSPFVVGSQTAHRTRHMNTCSKERRKKKYLQHKNTKHLKIYIYIRQTLTKKKMLLLHQYKIKS